MKFLEGCRDLLVYLGAIFTSTNVFDVQQPLSGGSLEFFPTAHHSGHSPEFKTPPGPEHRFVYRGCWLEGPNGQGYNITTNYEESWPEGITREYYLQVDEMHIDGDGVINPDGKVFNQTYPGPWIQACWGDLVKIRVKNKLQYNGTTIHWHGIRQLGTMEMDGVNGVTQCPIAPNDEFTYTFRATQYGTSWYHSHYSLQYADGVLGPLTIYGPASSEYDEAKEPILVSDWNHRSAFKEFQRELTGKPQIPMMSSVLVNGIGNYAGADPTGNKFTTTVEKGKKYLLRIINTSVDTTYLFSVDNHDFTVMTSDFVPIHPYNVTHILIGIGQRYHVVLNAEPIDNGQLSDDGNYWIRVIPADGCKGFEPGNEPDERQGILRYNESSKGIPTSIRGSFSTACRDENYTHLQPILPWKVDPVAQSDSEKFDVGLVATPGKPQTVDNFQRWALGEVPLWLNFSNPTIINLHNKTWEQDYVVIPKDYPENTWIYLVITAPSKNDLNNANRGFVPVAHPIHLHGHDFALLAQSNETYDPATVKLKFDNPPRRDVALLPAGGYLVIAFKADNPGSWLIHCHIAWHASSGLALQILERQEAVAAEMTPARLKETNRVCRNWDKWFSNPKNHWNQTDVKAFQDDSGI